MPSSAGAPSPISASTACRVAERYLINGKPAADTNLILTSWYSEANEPGLFARKRGGHSVTRLVVMDMDRGRYNKVELVRPDGSRHLRSLDSHGSGDVFRR